MTADTILYGEQRSEIQAQLVSKPIPDHRIVEAAQDETDNRSLARILDNRVHGLARRTRHPQKEHNRRFPGHAPRCASSPTRTT